MASSSTPTVPDAQVPSPPSERGPWLVALALGALGIGVLVAVLAGVVGRTTLAAPAAAAPPVVVEVAATPVPGPAASASVLPGATGGQGISAGPRASSSRAARDAQRSRAAIVAAASRAEQNAESTRLVDETGTGISQRWMEGFYPIYATAQSTFGVNWLLIASIHKQESAFSTAPTTYHTIAANC